MKGTWNKKWTAGLCISMASAILALSGCQSREPIETKVPTEISAESTTKAEKETAQTETESSGKPALRDAKVMTGGKVYAWVYDIDFSAAPQDYSQAGRGCFYCRRNHAGGRLGGSRTKKRRCRLYSGGWKIGYDFCRIRGNLVCLYSL